MAKYLLANTITVGDTIYRPAHEFDDAFDDVDEVRLAGGVLVALPNPLATTYAETIRASQAAGRADWETSASLLMSLAAQTPNGRPSIAWYPENEAAEGRVTEWADVEAFIAQHDGNCIVYIAGEPGSVYNIPATARVEGHGSLDFYVAHTSITSSTVVNVAPGAILKNVRQVYCAFDCGVTGDQSPFVLDIMGSSLQVREGGAIFCQLGSVSSPVRAEAIGNQVVFYYAGQVGSYEPTVPAIQIISPFFIFAIVVMIGTAVLPENTFGGDATPTIIFLSDANMVVTPQPLLLAPFSVQRQTAQAMLRPSASNTAGRPSFDLQVGQSHFDTDLGFRIDWNGTDWVDSQGNVV